MTKSAENIEKKIEAQLEKLKQLKAQKQAIEARERTKKKEQERKDDTRRKILLGSYLIKKMQANEANKEKILAELNAYLTENRDRPLYGGWRLGLFEGPFVVEPLLVLDKKLFLVARALDTEQCLTSAQHWLYGLEVTGQQV
ncbi:hypothetical protein, partial [Thiopseudomonas alkaliphila]